MEIYFVIYKKILIFFTIILLSTPCADHNAEKIYL